MNIRSRLIALLAVATLALQPSAQADDKKKKKQPSQAELVQQWKIAETQRQQAAARAAAAVAAQRRVAPPVRTQNPAVPLNTVAEDTDYNIVHLYNQSGGPVQVVQVSADGSTVKDFGTIPPYGLQGNAANQLRTKAGVMWAFVADGQVLTRYTVTTAPQQELVIRARAAAQPRPVQKPTAKVPAPAASADGSVKVLIFNRTASPVQVVQISPDGTAAKVFGEVPPTGANELPMPLQTFPGSNWAFTSGDDILATHTATAAPQQQVVVRAQSPPPQPIAPQAAPARPAAGGGFVQVLIFNRTNAPFQAVQISPDGNTIKDFGEVPPTGPDDLPTTLQTRPGIEWAFVAKNGKVLSGHTVTAAARQQVVVRP